MVAITHPFVSPKSDGADGTLLQPTAWNAEHTLAAGAAGGVLAMGNGAVIWNAGTSFPASKATGDRYFRTDLGMEFYWNETRWLSTTLYTLPISQPRAVMPLSATNYFESPYPHPTLSLYVEHILFSAAVNTTNDGTKYWTMTVTGITGTASTVSNTAGNWVFETASAGSVVAPDVLVIEATVTKVSTPGTILCGCGITYRYIAT